MRILHQSDIIKEKGGYGMRLFIAVNLSDDMKRSITSTLHEMKQKNIRGSYVPTQNLHLTLAFIGERKEADDVIGAMKTVEYKPFKLALSEMGTFGDLLWVGMKGNQGLSGAVKSVRDALETAGIPFDGKKFVPHITIIRKMNGNWRQVPAPKGEMMVRKISLMRSDVKNGKRVYTEILSI